jgi:L-malate glycosyltransferase
MMSLRKRRIVYVNHTGKVSGAEKILLAMLTGLDRARYEALVLCPAEGGLKEMLEANGVQCYVVPALDARFTRRPGQLLRYLASFIRLMLAMRREIARIDPDFVHANTLRAGIAATGALIGTGKPVVWHVHDILPRHPLSTFIRMLASISRRTQVLAASNATAQSFRGSWRIDRVRVIHNGIDLDRFPLKGAGDSPLKRELGLPEESFLACALGQICARKGLRELLDAFAKIYAAAPLLHLAIVGRAVFAHEESYRVSLEQAVAAAGMGDRVHFTGERSDASAVLRSADLLVLNSHEEPFGLVLIEAMSSGTPVLATRVGGIPEIVTDSQSGWLVETGDTYALAAKLLELSRSRGLLERVAQAARNEVCPRFSRERFLSNLHAFYAELAARPDMEWNSRAQIADIGTQRTQGDQHV